MKKLVVTADDVGLHPGMTAGALAAHDQGIVTAVSVAAPGRAFDDAISRLRDRPGLDVGIHWVLTGERPLSPPGEVRSLLGRDGALLPDYLSFAKRAAFGGIQKTEIETELRRQTERLLATGLPVVHANGHQHLHVLPLVFDVAHRLAEEYGIPWMRIPREPAAALPTSPRSAQIALLNHFGRKARRLWGDRNAVERTVGVLDAGHLTVERIRRALAFAGTLTELVCHPGLGNAELARAYDWGYDWDEETAALCEPEIRVILEESGVTSTRFRAVSPEVPEAGT